MSKQYLALTIVLLTSALLITGCPKAKPFDYHSGNEIPEGPGLFSKEKGEFTIYDSNKDENTTSEASSAEASAQSADAKSVDQSKLENDQDFKAFQTWKADQQEFKAFQKWKQSKDNAPEYEEFKEWQRWKDYKKWSDSNQQTK